MLFRSAKFTDILTRIRGNHIRANIAEIKKAATGTGGVRHDWRAADRMNAIIAPERFAQQQSTTTNNTAVLMLAGGEDQLRKLVGMWSGEAKQLQPAVEQPKIPSTAQDDKPIDG